MEKITIFLRSPPFNSYWLINQDKLKNQHLDEVSKKKRS